MTRYPQNDFSISSGPLWIVLGLASDMYYVISVLSSMCVYMCVLVCLAYVCLSVLVCVSSLLPSSPRLCGHWAFSITTIYGTDGLHHREQGSKEKGWEGEERETADRADCGGQYRREWKCCEKKRTTRGLIKPRVDETSRILSEKHRLLGDESRLPIKEHPVAAGYHGNRPPEMVSAVIMKPTRSAVCFFSASLSGFDKNIESCHATHPPSSFPCTLCAYMCEGLF